MRLTRRRPSAGDQKTIMSPRFGSAHVINLRVVKGTFRSYASLSTKIRSPSRMVGFIEPVGTSFQSATADRKEPIRIARTISGLIQSFQIAAQRAGIVFFISENHERRPSGETPHRGVSTITECKAASFKDLFDLP